MLFILYSETDADSISSNLGKSEYSYYFVLRGYRKVLETLGDVVVVQNPAIEVDPIYLENSRRGSPCVFLSFSPPHKTLTSLSCPTICVFAWEFSNIPNEVWGGDPRNDWRSVFAELGSAITLSTYTEQVVKQEMGDQFRITAIPVPMHMPTAFEISCADLPRITARTLPVSCTVVDSGLYQVGADTFTTQMPSEYFQSYRWQGGRIELSFKLGDEGSGLLGGFHEPEPWGAWSRIASPWILLPFSIAGRCKLGIELTAYGPNIGAVIQVAVGGQALSLKLTEALLSAELKFDVCSPANLIQFSGLDVSAVPDARDPRSMGIGLHRLWLECESSETSGSASDDAKKMPLQLLLDGVVYTSVLNPGDDRKNWIDMLTAFCYAFRDEPRATLVLKMTHQSLGSFLGQFHYMLQRVAPMRCRVVILHGYLEEASYQELIGATTYYVNTSNCEGLCLPLMEFMSNGIPALAPCHTAMQDYVDENNAYIIESSLEPAIWPHDPRNLIRTLRYRLNWRSIADAYQKSFRLIFENSEQYRRMSEHAQAAQREFCAEDVVRKKLSRFFNLENANSVATNSNLARNSNQPL